MLYHVSFVKLKSRTLYPRIPKQRADNENNTIKRICFATTIEKALTAMPHGGRALKNLLFISEQLNVFPLLHIYSIDESAIKPSNLLNSVAISPYVPDAEYTGEIWVIRQKVTCDHEIIKVTKADMRSGYDINKNPITEIKYLEWEPLKQIPSTSMETRFKGANIDIRCALATFDWVEFLSSKAC
ncbi:MAG: hypothetical protein ACE14V_14660 [bacterium]